MNRVYNYGLDPCGPVYITIGDGGNTERIPKHIHVDEPRNCPNMKNIHPEYGGVCPFKYTSGADSRFCWDRQPERSAYREYSFGHGILEVRVQF